MSDHGLFEIAKAMHRIAQAHHNGLSDIAKSLSAIRIDITLRNPPVDYIAKEVECEECKRSLESHSKGYH